MGLNVKVLGPSFESEMRAAGLAGLPFSWGSDGSFCGLENLSPEDAAKLQAVVDAHDPTKTPVPYMVTAKQARLALLAAGLLTSVEAAVKAAGGATQINWDYANEVHRDADLISAIGKSLGLTDAAIDLLFQKAAKIK